MGSVPTHFLTAARTCYCSEHKIFTRPHDCAALQAEFSKDSSRCAATIQCAWEHFSYCAAAHSCSLQGTLIMDKDGPRGFCGRKVCRLAAVCRDAAPSRSRTGFRRATPPRKPARQIMLLQENARPRSSKHTTQKLASLGYAALPRPPYSPDLAPSEEPLRGRISATSDDLQRCPPLSGQYPQRLVPRR
jgi:hypothetical protein